MKKLFGLLVAGVVIFSASAAVDAASAVRTEAPTVNYKTNVETTTVNSDNGTVVYRVGNSAYSSSHGGIDYSTRSSAASSLSGQGWTFLDGTVFNSSTAYNSGAFTNIDNTSNYWTTTLVRTTTVTNVLESSISVEPVYEIVDGVLTQTNVISNNSKIEVVEGSTEYLTVTAEPITLDIHNTGKITTARNEWLMHPAFYSEYASTFDFTGDGIADTCEWLSDNPDALLCMPENGRISSVTELFGNLGGYANGFDKLATLCDADGNGIVEGSELDGIMLWIDADRNGISDPGELKTLESYNISKIYTNHKNFVGQYETSDGHVHTMWAWFPTLKQ